MGRGFCCGCPDPAHSPSDFAECETGDVSPVSRGAHFTPPRSTGHTGGVADDKDTLTRINNLVAEEKDLRAKLQAGQISGDEEHARLRRVETELDQCWDLLRQRRALRETGGDPKTAQVRPAGQVEGYLN